MIIFTFESAILVFITVYAIVAAIKSSPDVLAVILWIIAAVISAITELIYVIR